MEIKIREKGLVGTVKMVGMDRGKDILQRIEEGVISASVSQQIALMPYYETQMLYNLNNSNILN